MSERTTRIHVYIDTPRERVYRALIDPEAIRQWRVPGGMRCEIHYFEAREGGKYRVSLTYEELAGRGKTTAHTDTYHGRFVKLVENEKVVEVDEFETDDPQLQGEMRMTITLADAEGGRTGLTAVHEGVPPGVRLEDNELGWRQSLAKLGALLEGKQV